MNLTKVKPLVIVILVIVIITVAIVVILGLATEKPQPQKPILSPPPTTRPTSFPTASPSAKLKQKPGFESELGKISQFLPYTGANFTVEYVAPLNLINAKIKADSEGEYFAVKTQIEEFIKSKGVTDICKLNIFWIPQVDQTVREVLKKSAGTLVTTGCRGF